MAALKLILVGKHLGERHQYLNNIVKEASERNENIYSLENPEETPIHRILKINLAIKNENIDYIIKTLKDDDMLYVSKALKSKWLIKSKFEHFLNPQYLEDYHYPLMITTAVTKMKHWIVINLKDTKRCQIFFEYYYEKNIEYAIKFLKNCSASFIEETFNKVKYKISPKNFEMLCEKSPQVAAIFFDALPTDEKLKEIYLAKEKLYFNTLRKLLKTHTDIVLNISEKYFNKMMVKCFSPKATKFIIEHHKERFLQKPELYTALLLDIKVLARCINIEEAMELTLRLAKDSYLNSIKWFSYKQVEPLVKRLKPEDRGAFKKKIFVEKDIGDKIKEWPYLVPSPPLPIEKCCPIFADYEHNPYEYQPPRDFNFKKKLKKRKYTKWGESKAAKTMLDKLFDEYRVASFDRTLFELRKRIMAESSAQNRQYMMLVLVSKSGGSEDNIASLMELLGKFTNEPPQIRAAIVRSLVNRVQIWRVAEKTWTQFLEFGHGLGLDGKHSEANCIEGIHAVVIRQIIIECKCDTLIFSVYMDNFSTLTTYSLSSGEKRVISDLLPKMLFSNACQEDNALLAVNVISKLLDTLIAFKLEIEKYPGLVARVKYLAEKDVYQTDIILRRLFKAKIARRELFKENFKVIQSEDSYLNALRHDITVISVHELKEVIKDSNKTYKNFFSKISIYFNEIDGLSNEFLAILKVENHFKIFAKPLSLLLGNELESYLRNTDSSNDAEMRFTAAIKANAHLARPAYNIDSFDWNIVGSKAIANKVLICRDTQVCTYVTKLRQNKRTIKLAFILSKRNSDFTDVFTDLCNIKPTAALKTGLKVLKNYKDFSDLRIWNTIKPLMDKLDITADSKKHLNIADITSMPIQVRPEYCIIVYKAFKEKSFNESLPFLCHIENLLQNVNEEFTRDVLFEFFNNNLQSQLTNLDIFFRDDVTFLYIRILIKYLLVCIIEKNQKIKLESIGTLFFHWMEGWKLNDKIKFRKHLNEMLTSFVYYKVVLNAEYTSCVPVMERALNWMESILLIEEHFDSYVHLKLNILYCKAIRKSVEMLSNHYIDDSNQEARKMVGNIFGTLIAQEVCTLTTKYFNSAKYLYKDILTKLKKHFFHSCKVFTESLIHGILNHGNSISDVLGVYLFKEKSFCLDEDVRNNILHKLKGFENIEVQMIVFAELF